MKRIMAYNGFSNIMLELVVWMIYLKSFGWSMAEIAILEGSFTLFSALFELPSGMIADKIGLKPSLQIGEAICMLYLVSYFFPSQHMIVFIGFIAFALGLSLISGTDVSMLYDSIEVQNKGKALKYIGYFNSIAILSVALGNLLGGFLAHFSWTFLFVMAFLLRLFALIIISTVQIEDSIEDENVVPFENGHLALFFHFLRTNKSFKYLLVTSAVSTAAITFSYQYGPIIFESNGISTQGISLVFGLISLLGAFFAFLPEKLTKFLSASQIVIFSLVLAIMCLIGMSIFRNEQVALVILLVIPNILYESWAVVLETSIQEVVLEKIRATLVSFVNLVNAAVLTVCSVIISLSSTSFSTLNIVSALSVFLLVIALMSYLLLGINNKKKEII